MEKGLKEITDEQIEICVEYFTKSHKNEKLMGTLVVIATILVSLLIFPLTKMVIGYILFCFLIYFKFLYDIKQKRNNRISKLMKKAEEFNNRPH